jgi:hypothetical protein
MIGSSRRKTLGRKAANLWELNLLDSTLQNLHQFSEDLALARRSDFFALLQPALDNERPGHRCAKARPGASR